MQRKRAQRDPHANLANPKYQTYLPLEYQTALETLAARHGKPEAAIVREAIRQFIFSEMGLKQEAPAAAPPEVYPEEAAAIRERRMEREQAFLRARQEAYRQAQEQKQRKGLLSRIRGK